MFNQLADAKKQKRLQRDDYYKDTQKPLIYMERSPTEQSSKDYLREKQMMVRSQLSSNTVQNDDRINLSSIIKYRLQSKKVYLPNNVSPEMDGQIRGLEQQKIIINNYLPRSDKYDSIKRQRKGRIKTYQDDDSESQQQNKKYNKALNEIDYLNQLFFRKNRKRETRIKDLIYQSSRMRRDFNHISRQRDFEKYIDHLDRLSSNKSQVKKQPYLIDTPFNYVNHKRLPLISPRKTEETNSIIKMSPVSVEKNNTNDTFIKILKKVKARGESLLVKLNKFPSLRLISK